MAKTCQKVPKGAKKAKECKNRKIPESTTLYLLKRKYMLNMLKPLQTAQNCKTQECQKVPKSATTYIIKSAKKYQKVPKSFLYNLI